MQIQAKHRLSGAFMGMTEDTEGQVATPSRKDTQEPAEGMGTDLGAGMEACYRLMDTVPHGFFAAASPEPHDWYDDRTPEERDEDTSPDNDWYDDGTASNDERRRHGLPAIPGR